MVSIICDICGKKVSSIEDNFVMYNVPTSVENISCERFVQKFLLYACTVWQLEHQPTTRQII